MNLNTTINNQNFLNTNLSIEYLEDKISTLDNNSAEWNYLMAIIYNQKGWFDSSLNYLNKAISLNPNNALYSSSLEILMSRMNNYSNNYYRTTNRHNNSGCCCCCDCDDCDCCFKLWCLDSCCECMGGDLITCC